MLDSASEKSHVLPLTHVAMVYGIFLKCTYSLPNDMKCLSGFYGYDNNEPNQLIVPWEM